MAKVFDAIDARLAAWIARQRMFFVATAPSGDGGHVNVSPKGPIETLRVLDEHTVAYLDLVGSGAETVAHLHDNGRIVVMLCAFEGPPRIVRLHGRGEVLDAGAVEFPDTTALPEQHRTVIRVAVERIADSCGFGVPAHGLRGGAPAVARLGADQAGQGRPRRARRVRGGEERGEHRRAARARLTAMRFEKWQALSNDYVIVEASELHDGQVTPELVAALCDRHTGIGADGVLVLGPPDEPGFVARLRIFNPDGSEAELSGNGARQAILYLRRAGWTDARQFSIQTAAGEIRPTILSDTTCRVDMGRASLRDAGEAHGFRFQHLVIGNPQTAIHVADPATLEALDLAVLGPPIETDAQFPRRTNVSWFTALDDTTIRARIFERGVGETASSGTGACGAAIAHVLRGGDSPVTVKLDGGELEVEVGEDLHVDLTGWAVPVFSGEIDPAFSSPVVAAGANSITEGRGEAWAPGRVELSRIRPGNRVQSGTVGRPGPSAGAGSLSLGDAVQPAANLRR